jgi:hypothetical protein
VGTDLAGIREAIRQLPEKPGGVLEETMHGIVSLAFLDIFWWLRR